MVIVVRHRAVVVREDGPPTSVIEHQYRLPLAE